MNMPHIRVMDEMQFASGVCTVLAASFIHGGDVRPDRYILLLQRDHTDTPYVICEVNPVTLKYKEWREGIYCDNRKSAGIRYGHRVMSAMGEW